MFLMEHLHCMACLVPALGFRCVLLSLIGLGGIEGFSILSLRSEICNFLVCYAFFSGSKAWRYGHVKSFPLGAACTAGQSKRCDRWKGWKTNDNSHQKHT